MKYNFDNELNILWLSDIHFKDEYTKCKSSELFNKYIDSFILYVNKLHKQSKFNYLLISGDIAQKGIKQEYVLFRERILDQILTNFKDVKLLVVPGNHDVNRSNSIKLKEEFIELDSLINRKMFIENNFSSFPSIFKDFTHAFCDNKNVPSKEVSTLKKNDMLYGHVIDKSKKTIFILFNSSWFSIGNGFLEYYLNNKVFNVNWVHEVSNIEVLLNSYRAVTISFFSCFITTIKNFVIKHQIINNDWYLDLLLKDDYIIDINDNNSLYDAEKVSGLIMSYKQKSVIYEIEKVTEEYGKQLLGTGNYESEIKEILDLIEDYSEYVVITIMHHPQNWLEVEERIPYEEYQSSSSKFSFHSIKQKSDMILTGHEHVPTWHKPEMFNGSQGFHFQAGCFIEACNPSNFNPKNNSFSTLSINITKRTVLKSNHVFENDVWLKKVGSPKEKPIRLNKKYSGVLTKKRSFCTTISILNKKKYINYNFHVKKCNFYISNKTLCYFMEDYYSLFYNFMNNYSVLKKYIDRNNIKKVIFYFYDHYHSFFEENMRNKDRLAVLDTIKRDVDFNFDKFRHDFFTNLTQEETIRYANLSFSIVVFPYWELENE